MSGSSRRIVRWSGAGLVLVAVVLFVVSRQAGCGFSGGGDWNSQPVASVDSAELLEGHWVGTWTSSQRDMDGALRCRVVKQGDGEYEARFEAIFAKYFTHESVVTLRVGQRTPAWQLAGEKDLGFLNGGVYRYSGHTDGTDFVCNYDSAYDKGVFRLKRAGAVTRPAASAAVP